MEIDSHVFFARIFKQDHYDILSSRHHNHEDRMTTTIEPTTSDFQFYSKFYEKQLRDELDNLVRWANYTERRLEDLGNESDTYLKQKERLDEYRTKIEMKREKMELPMDATNEEFVEYVCSQLASKAKMIENKKRKEEAQRNKFQRETKCMKTFRDSEYQHRRGERYQTRSMESSYRFLLDVEDKIQKRPDLLYKLRTMPNNRGIIFMGVRYYGLRPLGPKDNPNHLVMTESVKRILYIHETMFRCPTPEHNTNRVYQILSDNSPKVLIREEVVEAKS